VKRPSESNPPRQPARQASAEKSGTPSKGANGAQRIPKAKRGQTVKPVPSPTVAPAPVSSPVSAPVPGRTVSARPGVRSAQASRLRAARNAHEPDDTSLARQRLREASRARKSFERDEIRRFTAHVRRRRIAWLTGLGAFGAVLLFVAAGAFTPMIAVQEITVLGASRVPVAQIQAALQSEMGKPLPLVNFGAINDAVAAQPLIRSYSTESLPPHTLLIRIVERIPVGYIANTEGFTLVDAAGVVIEQTAERTPGYPFFEVTGNSTDSLGFQAAIDVLNALPASLAGQVDRVIATTTDDVVIVLADSGARVFWGGPDNASLKSSVLAALIANAPVGSVSEYDVSSPRTAVVR
jgi:cell division protein FtsQ